MTIYHGMVPSAGPGNVSVQNIMFTIGKNNDLVIHDETALTYPVSNYTYQLEKGSIGPDADDEPMPKIDLVIIENTKWVYQNSGKEMTLSTAYFDGPALNFKDYQTKNFSSIKF